jgi:hypothetical protein
MKDRKSLYLLIFALLVVTISFILISIWGYNFYFQPKVPQTITQEVQQPVPIAKKTSMKDSLQMLLASTVEQLGNHDSTFYDSSTDKTLELKLIEFNKLKNEIAEILKNKSSSKDMSEASEKIGQLQRSVDELRSKNDEVAKENMRLNKVLKQLIIENKSTDRKPKPVVDKVNYSGALPVLVSHLSFKGVTESDNNERETNIAAQTVKLTGSFLLNAKPTNNSTSIYVVIVKPDGNTLLNSSWQSGTFETSSGRQTYSALIHFDNVKDNNNRLQFTVDAHNFQKGKYAMQVYHHGIMIGRLVKTFY